ncbi:MAG: DNA-binding response regulator [Bacteroidetes bacterium HGW-Bacteroidetes-21]|nr:MAG: DNA-binding response regulator [Bacteroidetes bacterium HGW-Bacteroidetes-21]
MKIKCVVVDDEPLAIEKLSSFIGRIPYLELTETFTNPLDALSYLRTNDTDLLFLDIQMEDLTGIQLIDVLQKKPKIILTTAYDQYALKGYELNISDYLLKPISFERFLKAVNKVADVFNAESPVTVKHENVVTPSFIFVKTEYRMQRIMLDDILYVEGMKDYLHIITKTGGIMTLMNFAQMMTQLPHGSFIRVHKSYIVSLSKIESVERDRILINGKRIPVGETYRKDFYTALE